MREATSARSMPERRIAHAVSAMPPAPALANSRVAAWPARLICVPVASPLRETRPPRAGAPAKVARGPGPPPEPRAGAPAVLGDRGEEHDVAEEREELEGERQR